MPPSRLDVADALAEQHRELAGIIDGLADEQWTAPTRCPGWSVADVVLHLAQTDEFALASLQDRFAGAVGAQTESAFSLGNVDDGAAALVARERNVPVSAIAQRWRSASVAFLRGADGEDGHRRVTWVTGRLSVRTLITTRLAEAWIHTGDVADVVGQPVSTDARLRHVARLAWRTVPYAFERSGRELTGPVAFALSGPDGDHWDFWPDGEAKTVITGDAVELCLVAARRVDPGDTGLRAEGPDGDAVLELVRTYA